MDYKEPKTRTESKKGKKDMGPYSAKHVRLQEQLAEKRAAGKKAAKPKTFGVKVTAHAQLRRDLSFFIRQRSQDEAFILLAFRSLPLCGTLR